VAHTLAASNPEVIVTQELTIYAVQSLNTAAPVVFGVSGNPVDAKFVESFARPGGNLTGMSYLALELVGKRIEVLKEWVPQVRHVAVLARPQHPGEHRERQATQEVIDKPRYSANVTRPRRRGHRIVLAISGVGTLRRRPTPWVHVWFGAPAEIPAQPSPHQAEHEQRDAGGGGRDQGRRGADLEHRDGRGGEQHERPRVEARDRRNIEASQAWPIAWIHVSSLANP